MSETDDRPMRPCPHCGECFTTAPEWAGHVFTCAPMREIPWFAIEYSRHLCRKLGGCGEVFITAFAYYVQYVADLPCSDDLYTITPEARQWFDDMTERATRGAPTDDPVERAGRVATLLEARPDEWRAKFMDTLRGRICPCCGSPHPDLGACQCWNDE